MKISGRQIFWLLFSFITGNMILLTVSSTVSYAKQDAWISYLVASVFGIMMVSIAAKVGLLYPNQTLIEFSKLILGKWLGTAIVLVYLIQWYSVMGNILAEFAAFANTILLPTTPSWMMYITMLLLMIYVTYIGGIEGIGRCSEVFGPIMFLMIGLLIVLTIPNLEFTRILPVLSDTGFTPIWKGALFPLSLFGESVMMLMLVSFMDQPKKGLSSAVAGLVLTSCLVIIAVICVILTFGSELPAKLRFPAFDTIRYINVMEFIQNLEIIAVLVWILSVFIKLSVYMFLASYGTAQLFNVKDWRNMIGMVAIISFLLALLFSKIDINILGFVKKYWLPYVLPINMVGIPLLLWGVGSIRKRTSG